MMYTVHCRLCALCALSWSPARPRWTQPCALSCIDYCMTACTVYIVCIVLFALSSMYTVHCVHCPGRPLGLDGHSPVHCLPSEIRDGKLRQWCRYFFLFYHIRVQTLYTSILNSLPIRLHPVFSSQVKLCGFPVEFVSHIRRKPFML